MSRPKKKPKYEPKKINQELIQSVGEAYEKLKNEFKSDEDSFLYIDELAKQYHVSSMKMRKILISAGVYSTATSRLIAELDAKGFSTEKIASITGLKRSSINGYLPYKKVIYKNSESSVGADRIRLMRERKAACKKLCLFVSTLTEFCENDILDCNENAFKDVDNMLWDTLLMHENFAFATARGLKFKYTIKGGELFINRKENSKSLTKSSIFMAFHNGIRIQYQDGYVKGPKKLGTFGASYLYAIFLKFGIITNQKMESDIVSDAAAAKGSTDSKIED